MIFIERSFSFEKCWDILRINFVYGGCRRANMVSLPLTGEGDREAVERAACNFKMRFLFCLHTKPSSVRHLPATFSLRLGHARDLKAV